MKTRVRIINTDDIVHNARLLLVDFDDDGKETGTRDITEAMRITSLGIDLTIGKPATARVECICVGCEVDATLNEIVVSHVGPRGRLSWRILKWWWSKPREITAFGQRFRSYTP